MHVTLALILIVAAFVFFALATAAIPSPSRFQWVPAGLACLTLVVLLGGVSLG